jgi:hypothetical protein
MNDVRTRSTATNAQACWKLLSTNFLSSIRPKLTVWSRALLKTPSVVRPLDGFPTFYGNRRFITAFTRAIHLFPSWARAIQSATPHSTSLRSTLMLTTHLRFGLPSGLFPSSFPTNIIYVLLFPIFVLHAPLISFSSTWLSNYTWRSVQITKLFVMQFSIRL